MNNIKYLKELFEGGNRSALDKMYIKALMFNERAEELLKACVELLNKQNESPYVLNLLDELIYYDDCECDGNCLLEDIENLLKYRE